MGTPVEPPPQEPKPPALPAVVEVAGTPRDCGRSHGEQLRNEISHFYDEYMSHSTNARLSEADILASATGFLPSARNYAPELVDEVEGIAEGSGMSFEQIFALNCFDEIDCHGAQMLTELHGCTAFAATGRATSDGHTLIGQNSDAPAHYPHVAIRSRVDGSPATFVVTVPGVVGITGCNDRGLCQVWNTLTAADHGVGVPSTFVVRKALQGVVLAEMMDNVLRSQRANGLNFILGDALQAVNLELSARRYHLTYSPGVLAHANHYEAPELLDMEVNIRPSLANSFLRTGRMRELLDDRRGSIDAKSLQWVMRDHCAGSGAICRHIGQDERSESRASVIYAPADGKVWFTIGNPCQAEFIEYVVA